MSERLMPTPEKNKDSIEQTLGLWLHAYKNMLLWPFLKTPKKK